MKEEGNKLCFIEWFLFASRVTKYIFIFRSDRQPEFTQLDIELSFTSVEDILGLIEGLLLYSLPEFFGKISPKFTRMSYEEALENYGSDKPDVSFDYKVSNIKQ